MDRSHEADVVNTYRYLRLATVPLLLMLLISVSIEALRLDPDCLLGSISAYYYTPARGAFVGGLCAVGACLIIYKGNDTLEDVLLNFSGFMAFVVALVPTVPDGLCGTATPAQADDFIHNAVRNNVWTLLIAALLALVTRWVLVRRDKGQRERPPFEVVPDNPRLRRWTKIATIACWCVLLAELVLFLVAPGVFEDISHSVAAVTMVLGVIGVMVANARDLARVTTGDESPEVRSWANRYGVVAALMTVLLVATVAAHFLVRENERIILVLEVIVILNFLTFWIMQTVELWDYRTRDDKVDGIRAEDPDAPIPFRSL